MEKQYLRTLWLCAGIFISVSHITGQNILVEPFLQNATPNSIVIMWETDSHADSGVRYGPTPDLGNSIEGSSITTSANTILHTVPLTNLMPGTKYYYRAATGGWQSAIFDFVTPPLRDSEAPVNIALMSDMQKDGGNPNIFSNLINNSLLPYISQNYGPSLSESLQFTMIPGDLVDNGNAYNQWKNDFFNPGQALWRSVPTYPAIGNHEANAVHYFNYFNLPANGTPGYLEHWYTHDYSNVRVLTFDSNNPYRIAAQLNWLDSMLIESCTDTFIDFVFAQMHHPHKSELWTPGEIDYTGEIIARLETFSTNCGKPTIHFFGHTHAYSRGQSRDHDHLWVNVATAGGNIDYWGEFDNQDYDEFIISQDEYGFVMVEVTAGNDPMIVLKRLSFGDQFNPGGSTQTDYMTVRKNNNPPHTPYPLFPAPSDTVSSQCLILKADQFFDEDDDQHGASHWQVSDDSIDFTNPVVDSWKQYANWYNEEDLQAGDDLTDEEVTNLPGASTLWWRVRYRDKSLAWSAWSTPVRFQTLSTQDLTANLVINPGAENGVTNWTATTGVIESLSSGECNGIAPHTGAKYFAVGALCVEHAFASAYQDLDVTAFAAVIDSGDVQAHYGAYMADWQNTDEPSMALQFLDATQNVIGGTDTISHKMQVWTLKESTHPVPANTRTIRFIIMGTRFSGQDNDSYIDDISLRLIRGDNSCSVYQAAGLLHNRLYVDKQAPAYPDGRSWPTAFRTLHDALSVSNADTLIREIWIADGTYRVTEDSNRDTSFLITGSVSIQGGFSGVETQITEADPVTYPVILSGEAGNPLLAEDNVYHVIKIENTSDSVKLNGLNIVKGHADVSGDNTGAGILIRSTNTGSIEITSCYFGDHYATEGAAIKNEANTTLKNSVIESVLEGPSGSLIANEGSGAYLTIIESVIHQFCSLCPQAVRNAGGGVLDARNLFLEKN